MGNHLLLVKDRTQQADATVDVKADAAGRHDSIRDSGCRYTADGKAVAPVDIRHCDGMSDDSGQRRDVRHLLDGHVHRHGLHERVAGEDETRNTHAGHVIRGQLPADGIKAS